MAEPEGQTRMFRITPAEISAADAWIEDLGRRWGISERATFGARVCVAEIAANVLEHSSSPTTPPEFNVTLRPSGAGLDVEITDSGDPFDPTTAPESPVPRTIEAAQIGGLGLRLVRSYATNIRYRRDGVRNHLSLHLPTAGS
jgi:sigma-B regulation protein RsbU (phosphoserine phosphatase)